MIVLNEIKLDKDKKYPLYKQLYKGIKDLIIDNRIEVNTKLPSIRETCKIFNINSSTVVSAYNLLEKEGYVYKKTGSGTYIKNIDVDNTLDNKKNLNIIYDFQNLTADSKLFPVSEFKELMNVVIDRDGGSAFDYHESIGYLPLRKVIKSHLEEKNIFTPLESIQIISGTQQGIDILSKTILDYGDIVITEAPTYPGALYSFKSRSAKIIEIPVDRDGIDITILEHKIKNFKPRVIYTMPNFQNPTGFSYSLNTMKKILELAEKYNTYIIEDDYISDINFNNKKVKLLKSLDDNNRVIYLKSFSKTFMPGIRLGFAVLPIKLSQNFLLGKHFSDISTSGFIQRIFELYLKEKMWDNHIKKLSSIYKMKYDLTKKYIKKYIPLDLRYYRPDGGLNFWFALPDGYSSKKLEIYLKEKGILISCGSRFYSSNNDTEYFRINISSIEIKEIEKSIILLFKYINKFIKNKNNKTLIHPINYFDF